MAKMRIHRWQVIGVYFLVLALLVPAAASAKAEKPQYGGVLKIIERAEGSQPIGVPWIIRGNDTILQKPVLEPLLREDAKGGYHPWLATDWKIDTKNNHITLSLRRGVKFHDGTPFNAAAVKLVIDHSIKEKRLPGFLSVDIIDDHTILIKLEKYENIHLYYLASSSCNPISPTAFNEMGEEKGKWHPVGTGPFKFLSFKRGNKLVYERWGGYWNEGLPYLDGIEYLFIRDPMTQQAAMRARGDEKVHVLATNSREQAAMLKTQGFKIISGSMGPISLMPDSMHDNSPLSNRKVRQAVSYAINRESICKARGFGFWKPANQIQSPGKPGYVKDLDFGQYDPEKAKKLLKEAGYANGFKIKIWAMPGLVDRDTMVVVQRFLNEVGINVELEFPDQGGYAILRTDGWQNGLLAQSTRMMATFNITYNYFFRSKWWPSMKRTPGLIEAIEESLSTLQPEDTKGQAMTRMMANDAMFIPIINQDEIFVTQPTVHDTGYTEWSPTTNNTPETTWISKP